jgi:hypothetical protein
MMSYLTPDELDAVQAPYVIEGVSMGQFRLTYWMAVDGER